MQTDIRLWAIESTDYKSSTPAFTTYRNYVEDLERLISLEYGEINLRHSAIVAAFTSLPNAAKLGQRKVDQATHLDVRTSLERAWGMLRACWMPLEFGSYVTEFNASVPITVYYSTYHAALAATAATSKRGADTHRTTLNDLSAIVTRSLLPWPWSTLCTGPAGQADFTFLGFRTEVASVSALRGLPDDELGNRLGSMLRTTRNKELERKYGDRRAELRKANRKNLTKTEKASISAKMPGTNVFDVLYRIRKKANYEGADDFVLGPSDTFEARRFGESLICIADASVMALEALVDKAIGNDLVCEWLTDYNKRSGSTNSLQRHIKALQNNRNNQIS